MLQICTQGEQFWRPLDAVFRAREEAQSAPPSRDNLSQNYVVDFAILCMVKERKAHARKAAPV